MAATLKISDGTTEISLLRGDNGFFLNEWTPATPRLKAGGTFQSSPLSSGRRLVHTACDNTVESFDLKVDASNEDELIFATQELRRLLEKALAYWTTDWQNDPVWIEAQATCESNLRYALIQSYSAPQDDNPYAQPFLQTDGTAVFDQWSLIIEHSGWTSVQPGTGTATAIGAIEAYDGRNLGNVDSSGDDDHTSDDEVYVANKQNIANITDIYIDDGGVFSANLMDAALPFDFLPAVPVAGDAVYFGIDSTVADSGPFMSLVFDIAVAQTGCTIVWEFWTGAWSALTVTDNTAGTAQPFDTTGVNSVHWQQSNAPQFVAVDLNSLFGGAPAITAFWVRARVTVAAAATAPRQQNRDIYSVVWPYTEIPAASVEGDIPALIRLDYDIESNNGEAALYANQVTVGLRSSSRGANFTSFINCADEQNPAAITVTAQGVAAFANRATTPTGRMLRWNPGALTAMGSICDISLGTDSGDYLGTLRAYLRVNLISGGTDNVQIRLAYLEGAGNATTFNDAVTVDNTSEWYVLDLGPVRLLQGVVQPDEVGEIILTIQASSTGAADIYLYDLILIPVDEWAGDFLDTADTANSQIDVDNRLEMDSITFPKVPIRGFLREISTDNFVAIYRAVSNGQVTVQANAAQRLYFFSRRTTAAGSGVFISEPATSARVRLFRQQRYLSMRGAR